LYFLVSKDSTTPDFYVGDDDNPLGMAYAVPRGNSVAVGGLALQGDSLDPTVTWDEISERAKIYYPWLDGKKPTASKPIVGLRPVRSLGVRLEVERTENGMLLAHNYGHGGSGWSLSIGCAKEVKRLISKEM